MQSNGWTHPPTVVLDIADRLAYGRVQWFIMPNLESKQITWTDSSILVQQFAPHFFAHRQS